MSQYSSGIKAFTSGEALATRRRVKKSAATVVYADAGEDFIGVTEHSCASGEIVAVKLKNVSGTFKCIASEALAVNTTLYGADDGKVADTENGSAQFYSLEAATANNDVIECLPLDSASQAVHIGNSTTAVTLSAAGKGAIKVYTTCASATSTSVEPIYMKSTMTGAGGVGGRATFHMTTGVQLGGWANALKGYSEFTTGGKVTGLGSAVVAEMKLPNESLGSGGAYMPLEVELVYAGSSVVSAGALSGNHVAFSTYRFSGDTDGDFDDNGYWMTTTGLTAGAGHVLSANNHTLKCGIGTSTTRYLVLSQTENGLGIGASGSEVTYTAGTPLVTLYATAAGSGSTNCEPMYVYSILTGTSPVGGRSEFHTYANVACGGWMNAIKGYTQFGASGRVTGLASAVCAEVLLSAGTTQGTYAPLEAELVADSAVSTGTSTSFLYCNIAGSNGTGITTINTNGYFFEIGAGIADTAGGMFEAETVGTVSATHVLRVKIDGTAYWLALNTAKTM